MNRRKTLVLALVPAAMTFALAGSASASAPAVAAKSSPAYSAPRVTPDSCFLTGTGKMCCTHLPCIPVGKGS